MSFSTLSIPLRELLLRMRWHGRRLMVWGGWYLPVGVAALGCAALLMLAAREQRDAAARLQTAVPAAAASTVQGETAALPFPRGEAAVRQMMGQVFKLAEGTAVSLAQGEYKRLSEEDAPILRYEMQVPVTGELPAIRATIRGQVLPFASTLRVTSAFAPYVLRFRPCRLLPLLSQSAFLTRSEAGLEIVPLWDYHGCDEACRHQDTAGFLGTPSVGGAAFAGVGG